jgi:hypothetical protein
MITVRSSGRLKYPASAVMSRQGEERDMEVADNEGQCICRRERRKDPRVGGYAPGTARADGDEPGDHDGPEETADGRGAVTQRTTRR